jgi:hypothetical protein
LVKRAWRVAEWWSMENGRRNPKLPKEKERIGGSGEGEIK